MSAEAAPQQIAPQVINVPGCLSQPLLPQVMGGQISTMCAGGLPILPKSVSVKNSSPARLDFAKFTVKKGAKTYQTGGQPWNIEKDWTGHKGGKWKVFNSNNKRYATVDGNGKVVDK